MDYKISDDQIIQVANIIRQKCKIEESFTWADDFKNAISSITFPSGIVSFSQNGTYNVSSFANAIVNIPQPLGDILISENGTYDITTFSNAIVNISSEIDNINNYKIAIGAKSGSIYDTQISEVPTYGFYYRNASYGAPITGVEMTNVKNIGQHAFDFCSELLVASFKNCISIADYAFRGCTSLNQVSFPLCSTIYNFAFYDCVALTQINFPKCSFISGTAFANCYSLSQISFPLVSDIYPGAFRNCSNLTQISLPMCSYLTGSGIFSNCISLESIYLLSTSVVSLNYAATTLFTNTPITKSSYLGYFGSIYVPSSLVDAYKTANRWSAISDRITAYIE